MVWTSSNVVAGDDVLATDLNTLRADVIEVFEKAPPIGSVIMWAGGSGDVPDEWKLCNGSAISRATYSDLFTIQGVTFGAGNGSTTFNVPDMRDRFVVGAGTSYSANAKGGSNTVNLSHTHTVSSHSHSIAQHYHATNAHSHTQGNLRAAIGAVNSNVASLGYEPTGAISGISYTNNYGVSSGFIGAVSVVNHATTVYGTTDSSAPTTGYSGATSTGNTSPGTTSSGSSSTENRPPYIGILYIIKVL